MNCSSFSKLFDYAATFPWASREKTRGMPPSSPPCRPMNSTRPTESTAPVSCATSTTPMAAGGTTDTEKRRAPTAAHFRRERRRRQKALHQLKIQEAANKRLWEEKEAMQQEIERLKTDVSHRKSQADLLRHQLSFISSFRTEEDRYACRITASVLIDPRRIDRAGRTTMLHDLHQIAENLRISAADTVLKAMAESPVTLLDASPDAACVLRKAKDTWIYEYMERNPDARFLPDRALERLWNAALDAIREAAAAIPAGTKIVWVDMHKDLPPGN